MRVVVTGGRDFFDENLIFARLDELHSCYFITCLIAGGARGLDTAAAIWALRRGVPREIYPADWKRHGKAAGFLRNQEMLDLGKPNYGVAFPGGTGTADMMRRMKSINLPVWEITC